MASCHGILLFNLLGLQEEFLFKAKHKPKHQAPSTKHQAPSTNHQAPSTKHQAPITKHQAPSTLSLEA
jgi:hypothetical protein